jgi:hypothetical protein
MNGLILVKHSLAITRIANFIPNNIVILMNFPMRSDQYQHSFEKYSSFIDTEIPKQSLCHFLNAYHA